MSLCVHPMDPRGIVQLLLCWLHMLAIPGDQSSCLCNTYCIWSIVVVIATLSYYCTMGPWYTIFSQNCCSRPYWNESIISGSIMVLIIFFVYLFIDSSVAGQGSFGPSRVDLIYNRAICLSDLLSKYFLTFYLKNLVHVSTCLLLWWWHDDDAACSVFRFLQNVLNLYEIKLPPVSDIIFLVKWNSEKIILHTSTRLSALGLPSFWWLENCCDNLHYKGSVYCVG